MDRGEGTHGAGKGAGKGEGEDDDEGEETTLLGSSPGSGTRGDVETGTTGAGRVPGDGDGDRGVGGESAPAPWHKDECVRLATFSQVWCAFVVITGAELTPIWMATSRENGGLGFTAVDIGAFGSVMGVVILVFAATLFSFLADRFGVTRAVTWALAANGCIYLAHPLAWVAVTLTGAHVGHHRSLRRRARVHGPRGDGRCQSHPQQLRAQSQSRGGERLRRHVHQSGASGGANPSAARWWRAWYTPRESWCASETRATGRDLSSTWRKRCPRRGGRLSSYRSVSSRSRGARRGCQSHSITRGRRDDLRTAAEKNRRTCTGPR